MASRTEIIVILTGLEETCVRKEKLTDVGINGYIRLLEHLPTEVLTAAADAHASTNKWYPAPADLLEMATTLMNPHRKDGMEAWGEVRRALSQPKEKMVHCDEFLKMERPAPDAANYWDAIWAMDKHERTCDKCKKERVALQVDPLALRIAEGMGLDYLRMSENEMADRAHFIKAYEQLAAREKREAVMLPEVKELAAKLGNAKQLAEGIDARPVQEFVK